MERNWQDEASKPHSQASSISIIDLVNLVNNYLNKYRKSPRLAPMDKLPKMVRGDNNIIIDNLNKI